MNRCLVRAWRTHRSVVDRVHLQFAPFRLLRFAGDLVLYFARSQARRVFRSACVVLMNSVFAGDMATV